MIQVDGVLCCAAGSERKLHDLGEDAWIDNAKMPVIRLWWDCFSRLDDISVVNRRNAIRQMFKTSVISSHKITTNQNLKQQVENRTTARTANLTMMSSDERRRFKKRIGLPPPSTKDSATSSMERSCPNKRQRRDGGDSIQTSKPRSIGEKDKVLAVKGFTSWWSESMVKNFLCYKMGKKSLIKGDENSIEDCYIDHSECTAYVKLASTSIMEKILSLDGTLTTNDEYGPMSITPWNKIQRSRIEECGVFAFTSTSSEKTGSIAEESREKVTVFVRPTSSSFFHSSKTKLRDYLNGEMVCHGYASTYDVVSSATHHKQNTWSVEIINQETAFKFKTLVQNLGWSIVEDNVKVANSTDNDKNDPELLPAPNDNGNLGSCLAASPHTQSPRYTSPYIESKSRTYADKTLLEEGEIAESMQTCSICPRRISCAPSPELQGAPSEDSVFKSQMKTVEDESSRSHQAPRDDSLLTRDRKSDDQQDASSRTKANNQTNVVASRTIKGKPRMRIKMPLHRRKNTASGKFLTDLVPIQRQDQVVPVELNGPSANDTRAVACSVNFPTNGGPAPQFKNSMFSPIKAVSSNKSRGSLRQNGSETVGVDVCVVDGQRQKLNKESRSDSSENTADVIVVTGSHDKSINHHTHMTTSHQNSPPLSQPPPSSSAPSWRQADADLNDNVNTIDNDIIKEYQKQIHLLQSKLKQQQQLHQKDKIYMKDIYNRKCTETSKLQHKLHSVVNYAADLRNYCVALRKDAVKECSLAHKKNQKLNRQLNETQSELKAAHESWQQQQLDITELNSRNAVDQMEKFLLGQQIVAREASEKQFAEEVSLNHRMTKKYQDMIGALAMQTQVLNRERQRRLQLEQEQQIHYSTNDNQDQAPQQGHGNSNNN